MEYWISNITGVNSQYKKNCRFDLMFVTSQLKELLLGMLVAMYVCF